MSHKLCAGFSYQTDLKVQSLSHKQLLRLLTWADGGLCSAPFITAAVTVCHYVDQRSPALQPRHSFSALYANTARARVRDRRRLLGRIIGALQAGQKRRRGQWRGQWRGRRRICGVKRSGRDQPMGCGVREWCWKPDLQTLVTFAA